MDIKIFIAGASIAACLALAAPAAQEQGNGGRQDHARGGDTPRQSGFIPSRPPVVINMSRPSSGGFSRNYPVQTQASRPAPVQAQPSWGRLNRSTPLNAAEGAQAGRPGPEATERPAAAQEERPAQAQAGMEERARPETRVPASTFAPQGMRAAAVAHHHPYTPGYIRHKLQKLGVSSEPAFITDRSEIIHTDRQHSTIELPARGPDGSAIRTSLITPRGAGFAGVREQMKLVSGDEWRGRLAGFSRDETKPGQYYWHRGDGFDYCHYRDDWGYDWFGWYLDSGYFWTRNFNGRWWWYDADNARWDFYNDGFFWWQDPYHVGDLYCYSEGAYVPVNSQEDQIVVTQPVDTDMQSFTSPDGARVVKLVQGSGDAFLYDTAVPPSFDPVYLASGVSSVEFSDTSNGRPLEILVKVKDGSIDLFDGMGQAYGPGNYDQDQAEFNAQGGDTVPQAPQAP
jgi:hypothetical protein